MRKRLVMNRHQPLCAFLSRSVSFAFAAGLILGGGTLSAQDSTSALIPDTHPLAIGAGDMLVVAVFDTPSLSFTARVDESGKVKAPVVGPISVAGLTTSQAARMLEDRLRSDNIMHDPSVTVQDQEFATQGIVVLGEVHNPGTYTLLGPHSLYDALSAAGGTSDTAGASITITHRGDSEHPVVIPVNSANYSNLQRTTHVYPGDTIYVSKAEVVYVVGDVGRSGAYYLQHGKQLTVLNILALAGGDTRTSSDKHSSIVRTTSSGVVTIPVNLDDIKANKTPDIRLLADDILVVPRSSRKVAETEIIPGVTLAVTSAVVSALLVR